MDAALARFSRQVSSARWGRRFRLPTPITVCSPRQASGTGLLACWDGPSAREISLNLKSEVASCIRARLEPCRKPAICWRALAPVLSDFERLAPPSRGFQGLKPVNFSESVRHGSSRALIQILVFQYSVMWESNFIQILVFQYSVMWESNFAEVNSEFRLETPATSGDFPMCEVVFRPCPAGAPRQKPGEKCRLAPNSRPKGGCGQTCPPHESTEAAINKGVPEAGLGLRKNGRAPRRIAGVVQLCRTAFLVGHALACPAWRSGPPS
jgi:hypothetical protein